MAGNITTIKLEKKTKDRLEHLRSYKRETYEEIVQNILNILNICLADPEKARSKLITLNKRQRIKAKRDKIEKLTNKED